MNTLLVFGLGYPLHRELLSSEPRVMATTPGRALMGYRFDQIIITEPLVSESETEQAKLDDWYDSCLLTKLVPGGTIVGYTR